MFPVLLLIFLVYVLVSGALAWLLAGVLTRRAREPWVRWVVAGVLAPIVFLLPLADEIVGYFQFERLCEQAKEAKIYGSIPVGEDLYTPEGKWRYGLLQELDVNARGKEAFRLRDVIDSYVRKHSPVVPQEVPAAITIRKYEDKNYDAKNGRLLAEWRRYGTSGGWLSQILASSGDKIIVRQQCMPEIVSRGEIYPAILKFKGPEATK